MNAHKRGENPSECERFKGATRDKEKRNLEGGQGGKKVKRRILLCVRGGRVRGCSIGNVKK